MSSITLTARVVTIKTMMKTGDKRKERPELIS